MTTAEKWAKEWADDCMVPEVARTPEYLAGVAEFFGRIQRNAWQSSAEAQREACAAHAGTQYEPIVGATVRDTPLVPCPAPEEK